MLYIGIDIGKQGCCSFFKNNEKNPCRLIDFKNMQLKDFYKLLIKNINDEKDVFCCIEKVHAHTTDGVVGAANFGYQFGYIESVFNTFGIPYILSSPQEWKKYFKCIIHKKQYPNHDKKQLKFKKKEIVIDKCKEIMDNNYIIDMFANKFKNGKLKGYKHIYDGIMIGKFCQENFNKIYFD